MVKKILCAVCCGIFVLSLACCGKTEKNNETTETSEAQTSSVVYTSTQVSNTESANVSAPATLPPESLIISETIQETAKPVTPATVPTPSTVPETEETTAPQTSKALEKTGEMLFSDDPDNRYISAVSSKYGVDSQYLVALYTVPENDSNIVLQFDGTKNPDGTLIRNKDTLIAIYTIDRSLNSKRASEDSSLNEYSYGEMKVMFFSTTTYIMGEFDELK